MTERGFKDHFSGHAVRYAAARPSYPDALFDHLAGLCRETERAWDCATGNGQAARSLVDHFDRVIATDASEDQICAAAAHPHIEFRVAPAEASQIDRSSIDLITVAQALHWFDIDAFFAEARAVLKPDGVLAYWSYGLCTVSAECDAVVNAAYQYLDNYWPPERAIVDSGYRDIEAPMPSIDTPSFEMRLEWTAEQMLAYLDSWSAAQRYRRARGADPLDDYRAPLIDAWGATARPVSWPLHLTVVRLEEK